MTICVACGRRTDPNRSFCSNCGSAVFIDSNDRSRTVSMVPAHDVEAAGPPPSRTTQRRSPRSRQQMRTQPSIALPMPTASAGAALWGLIKFGIFIYAVYYAFTFLTGIPEVRTVVDDVQQGRSPDMQPALDAIRSRFEALVLQSSSPESREPAAPANGTSANTEQPRVVRRVPAEYTPEARRARVEGTVLLRAMVQPDGTVSDVSVVRSLDTQYGLDEQAMMALRQWTFEPQMRNGEPVRSIVQVQMTFALR